MRTHKISDPCNLIWVAVLLNRTMFVIKTFINNSADSKSSATPMISSCSYNTIATILDSRKPSTMIKIYQYSNTSTDTIRNRYIDFIRQHGPFAYYFTLTFPKRQTDDTCTQQINHLLYLLNKKIFRNSTTDYLTGFCVYERHGDFANNSIHCHALIRHDPRLDPESKPSFLDHFLNLINSNKIRIVRNYRVTDEPAFRLNCCNIQRIYNEEKLYEYMTKTIDRNFDFNYFKPITKNGI